MAACEFELDTISPTADLSQQVPLFVLFHVTALHAEFLRQKLQQSDHCPNLLVKSLPGKSLPVKVWEQYQSRILILLSLEIIKARLVWPSLFLALLGTQIR